MTEVTGHRIHGVPTYLEEVLDDVRDRLLSLITIEMRVLSSPGVFFEIVQDNRRRFPFGRVIRSGKCFTSLPDLITSRDQFHTESNLKADSLYFR